MYMYTKFLHTKETIIVDFVLAIVADYCYNTGAISRNTDNVVTACVNGYNTNVCYPNDYDAGYSLAVAACNSQGLQYDCEYQFSFVSVVVDSTLCLQVYHIIKYLVQEVISLTSLFCFRLYLWLSQQ